MKITRNIDNFEIANNKTKLIESNSILFDLIPMAVIVEREREEP